MSDLQSVPGGVRLWVCDKCGKRAPWGDGWRWLGFKWDVEGTEPQQVICPDCPRDPRFPSFD